MMKNKLSVLLASTLLVTSLSSVSVFAFGTGVDNEKNGTRNSSMHKDKGERFMQHKFKKMARFLNLTEEQRQEAKVINQQAKVSRSALKENMKSFHQQSKELVMADTFDEQAFLDLQSQHQGDFAQMALIKVKSKHSFMKILTEEQKEKMKTLKSKQRRNKNVSD